MERLRRIRTDKWRTLAALAVYAMLLAGWPSTVEANTGALIKSKSGQPLTSSTLSWVSISSGLTAVPDDAVQGNGAAGGTGGGGGGGGYVCRFQHAGRLQIGSTVQPDAETDDVSGQANPVKSGCRIVYYGRIINRSEKYEVLVNVHGAGRLVWQPWDKSTTTFTGAVQVGEHYVARVLVQDETTNEEFYRLGHLDPSVQRGRIFTVDGQNKVAEAVQGEILVEVEPVAYELGPLQWARHRRKIQSQEDVQLAHTILDNEIDDLADLSDIRSDIEPQTVASTLTYVASHAVYLGQVRGMVKGLESHILLADGVSIAADNGTTVGSTTGGMTPFSWGDSSTITASFPQVLDVSQVLDRGTAVNVTLTARRVTFDGPYAAALTTKYADGSVTKRQIDGQARQTMLEDLRVSYSPAYYLSDGSPVPQWSTTASTPSTTETTTTTTTPTPAITTEWTGAPTSKIPLASSKQTKETLELKSRKASAATSSSMSPSTATVGLFVTTLYVIIWR